LPTISPIFSTSTPCALERRERGEVGAAFLDGAAIGA